MDRTLSQNPPHIVLQPAPSPRRGPGPIQWRWYFRFFEPRQLVFNKSATHSYTLNNAARFKDGVTPPPLAEKGYFGH